MLRRLRKKKKKNDIFLFFVIFFQVFRYILFLCAFVFLCFFALPLFLFINYSKIAIYTFHRNV